MPFGQLVIGPPGSGKTTYCHGMQQFLQGIGRPTIIVNLDPANDSIPYDCSVNVFDLIHVKDAMEAFNLGPNGAMMYCMEYLAENLDWLEEKLKPYKNYYALFDCPGQVEFYTHHKSFAKVATYLQESLSYRIATIHLVDAHHCSDPAKFIAATLLSLTTMTRLETPHVNVLSKIDMIEALGPLHFGLDFYTDLPDLRRVVDAIGQVPQAPDNNLSDGDDDNLSDRKENTHSTDDTTSLNTTTKTDTYTDNENIHSTPDRYGKSGSGFLQRWRGLHEHLCELVDDFNMVHFQTLNIQEKESVLRLVKVIDKANGYVFGLLGEHSTMPEEIMNDTPAQKPLNPQTSVATASDWHFESVGDVEERYTSHFG